MTNQTNPAPDQQRKCSCGRRALKQSSLCKPCDVERRRVIAYKNAVIVVKGECPDCGSPLHRNNALHGWWQCDQFGADGFRKDDARPACSFQLFVE